MARKSKGRRRVCRNKGFFFRRSRKLWCANEGGRVVRLTDEHLTESVVKVAYARFRASPP